MVGIYDRFLQVVEKRPHDIALATSSVALSYQVLKRETEQSACAIYRFYKNRPMKACILLPHTHETIIILLALISLKITYIPLEANFPLERIKRIIKDSQADLLIYDEKIISLSELGEMIELININELISSSASFIKHTIIPLPISENPIFSIMYTSGSTGQPKGSCIKEEAVVNLIDNQHIFSFLPTDNVVHHSSLAFDLSTFEIFGPLLNGCRLIVIDNQILFNTKALKATLSEHAITVMWLTSQLFNNLFDIDPLLFKQLRTLIIGGEQLSAKRVLALYHSQHRPKMIINGYGPTEATVFTTFYLVTGSEKDKIPIGTPLNGVQCFVQDDTGNIVTSPGIKGELLISGKGLSAGYYCCPELNEKSTVLIVIDKKEISAYRSGDIVEYDSQYNLVYHRRKDTMIKFNGLRIDTGEIDHLIESKLQAQQAFTTLYRDHNDRPHLISFILRNKEADLTLLIKEKWIHLYNYLYKDLQPNDDLSDRKNLFIGWNSSIDNQPFPLLLMQQWKQDILHKLKLVPCKKILDIGSGTGIFTSELINDCEYYTGIDTSTDAIAFLKKQYAHFSSSKLELFQGDFLFDYPKSIYKKFDTIILNSVIQYFPHIAYFEAVLTKCLSLLESGGSIYIGDIRNYALLSNLSLKKSSFYERSINIENINQINKLDIELQIDPQYFIASSFIEEHFNVCIFSKYYGNENELSLYRYDVILTKIIQTNTTPPFSESDFIPLPNPYLDHEKTILNKLKSETYIHTSNSDMNSRLTQNSHDYILLNPFSFNYIIPAKEFDLLTFSAYFRLLKNHNFDIKMSDLYSVYSASETEISQYYLSVMKQYLPQNMLPKILFVDQIPVNHAGKIDKQTILSNLKNHLSENEATNILELVAQRCQLTTHQVLEAPSLSYLGFTSLDQLYVTAKINEIYHINLSPFDPAFKKSFPELMLKIKQHSLHSNKNIQCNTSGSTLVLPLHYNKIDEQKNLAFASYNNVLVKVNYPIQWNPELWNTVIHKVWNAHSALRMNFKHKRFYFCHQNPEINIFSYFDPVHFENICSQLKDEIVDIEKSNLIRFLLFKVHEKETVLLIYFHHLLMDLKSIHYLLADLHTTFTMLYNKIDYYPDPSHYERCISEQLYLRNTKAYKNRLRSLSSKMSFATTSLFPYTTSYSSETFLHEVDEILIKRLQLFTKEKHASFFVVIMANYLLAISQLFKATTFPLLYVGSKRSTASSLKTLGLLSDYMVIIKKDASQTISALCQDIANQMQVNDIFYHDLLTDLSKRNPSFHEENVFNLLFDYQDVSEDSNQYSNYQYELLSQNIMKRYITFRFIKNGNKGTISIRYRKNIFSFVDIKNLIHVFITLCSLEMSAPQI